MPNSEDVRASFGPVAANYAASRFHAGAAGIQEMLSLAAPRPGEVALDVATGTGNVALALAGHLAFVVGIDLTPQMLGEARRQAGERGIRNAGWVLGDAAALPFREAGFDLCTVRSAPHHFLDLEGALAEAGRVLRRQGRVALIDCSPPAPAREHLHPVELGRDPSHVRSRTLEEWVPALERAGLRVESAERRELDWDFDQWMANMAVPAERSAELAAMVESARGPARAALRPERRGGRLWHAYWHALIRARRP